MEWIGKGEVLEYYPETTIRSAHAVFRVPAVLKAAGYVHKSMPRTKMLPSRVNILLRDQGICQCALAVHLPVFCGL